MALQGAGTRNSGLNSIPGMYKNCTKEESPEIGI